MNKTKFTEKMAEKELIVERIFNGSLGIVWRAWTEAEMLDKWWGPKPWKTETIHMEFKEGGYWHYAMSSPEGEKHFSRVDFKSITWEKNFTTRDGFCDENANINDELPTNKWETYFESNNNSTKVTVKLTFDSEEDMKRIIEMGFKDGFADSHKNLDELLKNL